MDDRPTVHARIWHAVGLSIVMTLLLMIALYFLFALVRLGLFWVVDT